MSICVNTVHCITLMASPNQCTLLYTLIKHSESHYNDEVLKYRFMDFMEQFKVKIDFFLPSLIAISVIKPLCVLKLF